MAYPAKVGITCSFFLISIVIDKPLVRILCIPDVQAAIGGVKQLYRHVEHLTALGWDAAVITENKGFRPSWFQSSAPSFSLEESFGQGDFNEKNLVIVLPETYLGINFSNYRGIDLTPYAKVVFNQNAYYSFGQISDDTSSSLNSFYDNESVLKVLTVSEDTHFFLSRVLGLNDNKLCRIINAVEPVFVNNIPKENVLHWMPRKNPDHVNAILQGISRSNTHFSNGWSGRPLQNISHGDVADSLNRSRIFLSFGHPEGFGLPIAEAMASGCWVVGYSGGGGRELFRFGASTEVPFGDWSSFVLAVNDVFKQFSLYPRETSFLLQRQSQAIRALYSADSERESIKTAWDLILTSFVTTYR